MTEAAGLTAAGEEVFKPHIKKNLTPGANNGQLIKILTANA